MSGRGPLDPGLIWTEQGPRSSRFDDVYFSAEDGLAEARAVFLAGCDLPLAWRAAERFVVGELGFGSGLNVLALLDLWRRERPEGGRLHVFTIEAFPLSAEEAARAHARWPELEEASSALLARWPSSVPGFHRIDLPEFDATIDLAVGDVAWALGEWSGAADAWFLDGFAPATNPDMWRAEVLELVAARSTPGARAATFTVAGQVRRGLQAAGFEVAKRPGFGKKRERLEARLPEGPSTSRTGARSVVVVGAGIAGASLTRALRRLGASVVVIDPAGPGAGASGAPAALVSPRIDAGGGLIASFFAQASRRAAEIYGGETPDAILAQGVLRLERTERDGPRFDRIAGQDLWAERSMTRLSEAQVAQRVGEPAARGGLWEAASLAIEPLAVLRAFLEDVAVINARVGRIDQGDDGVRVVGPDGALIAEAQAAFVAAGPDSCGLGAPKMQPVRGQVSIVEGAGRLPIPLAWGGYATPTRNGFLFGATHDRDDRCVDARSSDDARNLASLREALPRLADLAERSEVRGRASVRATTRDRMPMAGGLGERVLALTGLGSRGFLTAPLLAEHVAAQALGAPSPLPSALARLVAPLRPGIEFV